MLNASIQATLSYPDDNFERPRTAVHFICLSLFFIETLIRIFAEGKKAYFYSMSNILDFIVIVISFVTISLIP